MCRSLTLTLAVAGALAGAEWNPFTAPAVPPRYAEVQVSSVFIPMADGVRLAADVVVPRDLPVGQKVPAILKITRYGRAAANGNVAAQDRFWVTHGFARVLVDERGTGASFGTVRYGKSTLGDLWRIVDWVVAQEWSNGRVGAIGNSYEGTTAELLAACGHPAVRAVMPLFSDFNYYTDLIRPGGVFNDWLLQTWGTETRRMDSGEGAKRVDGDKDGVLLKQAIVEHAANPDIYAAGQKAEFLDDPSEAFHGTYGEMNNAGLRAEIEPSRVPMLIFAGWMDAGTVQGAIQRFRTFSNPQRVIVGPWSHGAGHHADPFAPSEIPEPSAQQRLNEAVQFFDRHLNATSEAAPEESRLYYVTMGENAWKSTTVWPPAGFAARSLYLAAGGVLRASQKKGPITVQVGGTATGERNRWHTQLTGSNVDYTDKLPQMEALASFTSSPMEQTVEITGQPVLRISMRVSREDPTLLAYLVTINPHNRPVYLTEGHLRLVHRKADSTEQTLHSYRRGDAQPVKSGDLVETVITLLPTSVLVPAGYRIRLLLASSDRDNFPASPAYSATIDGGSRLELPMAVRKDAKLVYTEAAVSAPVAGSWADFSGTWKLNLAESDYSDPRAARPESLVRTVKQSGESLQYAVERHQNGRTAAYHVTLKIGGRPYESNEAGVVSAKWEGTTLVIQTLYNPGTERHAEQMERWVLSADGRRVTEALSLRIADGTEVRIQRVFDKQ